MRCDECVLWVQRSISRGRTKILLRQGICLHPLHDSRLVTCEGVRCSRGIKSDKELSITFSEWQRTQIIDNKEVLECG